MTRSRLAFPTRVMYTLFCNMEADNSGVDNSGFDNSGGDSTRILGGHRYKSTLLCVSSLVDKWGKVDGRWLVARCLVARCLVARCLVVRVGLVRDGQCNMHALQ
ncbi:unnamed protein product [Discosporangium mesarthrocarpum]